VFELNHLADRLQVTWDGESLVEHRFGRDGARPYLHPLRLPGGPALTLDSPADHVHHQGVWLAWKSVNGVNFWEQPKPGADPEGFGRIVHRGTRDESVAAARAAFVAESDWIDWQGTVQLRDVRETIVHKPGDRCWRLDLHLTLTADARETALDLKRGESGQGGCFYSGLTIRFDNGMTPGRLLDAEGRTDTADIYGQRARWCGFSGTHPEDGEVYGITMVDHPGNPRFPTPWWVRNSENYAVMGPSLCYHEPLALAAGQAVAFRYRLVVHRGPVDPDVIEAAAPEDW